MDMAPGWCLLESLAARSRTGPDWDSPALTAQPTGHWDCLPVLPLGRHGTAEVGTSQAQVLNRWGEASLDITSPESVQSPGA